ncbi:hypothetical protein XP1511_22205 [Xanthomonas perforans]|nr:hypothetical protein XP1511_22205 [Xanthomonas perforans]RXD96765.1 hypothetical protein DB770_13020 [Xanthomonas perforans]TQT82940.1 hypothetical protein DB758_08515 [Xanthomonas perforans]
MTQHTVDPRCQQSLDIAHPPAPPGAGWAGSTGHRAGGNTMKDFLKFVAGGWAFGAVVSALIVAYHYLASPWDDVAAVFLCATGVGVMAYLAHFFSPGEF